MGDRVRLHAAVTAFVTVLAVMAAFLLLARAETARARWDYQPSAPLLSYVPRASRLTPTDWRAVKGAARLRRLAVAPGRSAFYRHFAAYLALSVLTRLHGIRRGRCAVAISYLYDNLLDLADAYPGEDWRPLRRLIRKQPSLNVCAPKTVVRVTYVS